MKIRLKHVATWLILIALSIACTSTESVTPQRDQPAPTTAIAMSAPYSATPVKSPSADAFMNHLVVALDGAVWFSFGSYDWSHPYGGGVSRYDQGKLTHFTTDDGLPHDNVQALKVAPDGTVWVGALCGIARYDGQAWRIINNATDCQSIGGPVIDFAFTPDGSLWVGTAIDVAHFDGKQWTRYDHLSGWLAITTDGTMWATGLDNTGPYLARFTGSTWTKLEQPYSGGIVFGNGDSVWVVQSSIDAEHSRLARFNGQTWEAVLVPTSGPSNVKVAPDGVLWALTNRGLARFNGTLWLYDTGITRDITSLAFAPDGTLWLGGRGGELSHYQPATGQLNVALAPLPTLTPNPTVLAQPTRPAPVGPAPVIPAPSPSITPIPQLPVTNLVVTPDGAVWYSFGNFDFYPRHGGIVRSEQGGQTRFMSDATVQLLKVAPDGSLWAGAGCSLLRFDGQTWQTVLDHCDKLRGNIIDVAFTPDGAAWIATGFNLAHYQNGEWTIMDRLVNFVAVTPDGALWVSGWEGAQGSQYVARFDGTKWTIAARAAISQLLVDSDSSVWGIKNDNTLVRFEGANPQTFANLPFDQIDDLTSAPNGEVWAATDQGVVRFDGSTWRQATGLPNGVTQIAFAPDGSIWLGDWTGTVSRVDPATIEFTILPARPTVIPPIFNSSLPTPPPTPAN